MRRIGSAVLFYLSERVQRARASKIFRQRLCMCFLFSDDEFSATALLSESARIKNTYTDGTKLHAFKNKIYTDEPL